jgi:hypothetical protein
MDLGKLSLIVSCLAFFLAIPLSILGNILTPRVRDWYAANAGRQRLEKRISTLQGKLHIAEESWCFTDAEWEIYEDSYWNRSVFLIAGMVLLFLVFTLIFLQLSSLGYSGTQLQLSSRLAKQVPGGGQAELMAQSAQFVDRALMEAERTSPLVIVLNIMLLAMVIWRDTVYVRNRANHSEKGRKEIRKRIDKLSQKLPVSPGQGASGQV